MTLASVNDTPHKIKEKITSMVFLRTVITLAYEVNEASYTLHFICL